ncbi:hypothetical protein [Frisingicoccus sp.]|uniref:hypothetical protein n=1 Tax=Frisingicoccus sp. TaxID=1918627 RepID=UPI003AB1A75B
MLKKRIVYFAALLMMITGVLGTPVICHGEENSDLIAGDDERAAQQTVGEEGAEPVYAENLIEGTYEIEVDSSSSMFRIVHADLTVKDGRMTAVLTLGGTGYLKLFMGTGEEAVAADESAYAAFVEDSEGAYTYEVPVEALNKELECTGFSKRKEKWYDHQIFFKAETLPEEAFAVEAETIDLKDGEYTVQVDLAGGTGRAEITSPAVLRIEDQSATAVIEWSSSNYDYMVVNGKKYFPVNSEGNSVFEIPVLAFDKAMTVTADTTAMSTPHEIEYMLTFDKASIQSGTNATMIAVGAALAAGAAVALSLIFRKKKGTSNEAKKNI